MSEPIYRMHPEIEKYWESEEEIFYSNGVASNNDWTCWFVGTRMIAALGTYDANQSWALRYFIIPDYISLEDSTSQGEFLTTEEMLRYIKLKAFL